MQVQMQPQGITHWTIIVASFIAAVPPTITAIAALIVSMRTHEAAVRTENTAKNTNEVAHATAKAVDGIVTARVEAAKAEGRADERKQINLDERREGNVNGA